jgi:hypothetical protein
MAPGANVVSYLDRSWYGNGTSFSTSWVSGWAAGYMAASGSSAKLVTRADAPALGAAEGRGA